MSATPRAWAAAVLGHPRHTGLAGLVAGLLTGPRLPVAVLWAGTALVAVALAAALSAGRSGGRIALSLGLAATLVPVGAWVADERLAARDRTQLAPLLGHAMDLTGVVLQPARARSFERWAVLVEITGGPGSGERVLVLAGAPPPAGVGDEVRVRGGLQALPPFEAAMARAGAHAAVTGATVVPTGRRRGGVLGVVDGVRRRAEAALGTGVPDEVGALAQGMVLGADDALPERMRDEFRASGLAHLVAASGANVALLATLVLALGAALGLSRRGRLAGALVLVVGYVPLAGGGPSIQRAGVMGAATLVAALASQPASRWYAVLLAAAATLTLDPRAAEDPGWQLSFAAVLAIVLLAPPLARALERRLPQAVAQGIAVSVAASAATAPLIALHFGRLSWVTVPANLLALPAVAPVMWLGSIAAALGQVSSVLAAPVMAVAAWPLAFVAWVAHAAAGLPGADAEVAVGAGVAAGWAAILAVLSVGRGRRAARRGAPALLAVAACAAALLVPVGGASPPPPGLSVAALDVGQGDATLIRHGPHAILVDTGPAERDVVERLEEQGVEQLDLLVITHAQADHEGGAADVLEALPVTTVLDGRDGVRTAAGAAMAAAARERSVPLVPAAAGQRLRAGPLVLDVLSPPPEPARLHAGEDPNHRAVVAELRVGDFSMLLPADAESDVLARLPLRPVDVLKVPHHGSADPGLPALLDRLRPHTAIVEVGEHNTYGHPAPDTLAALAAVPRVHRTDRDGTVVLRP